MDTIFMDERDRTPKSVNLIQPNRLLIESWLYVSAELRLAQSVLTEVSAAAYQTRSGRNS